MLTKTTIALSVALAMGAASAAMADYQFDATGAPVDMHIVDAQNNAFASTRMPADVHAQHVAPFTAQEKALFDRQTYPTDSY